MRFTLVVLALTVAACGESVPSEPGAPPLVFDMAINVAAGEEIHACQFVKMPDEGEEVFVTGGQYDTSPGTSHFLVFRTAPDMPPQPLGQPVDCYEGDGVMQYERGFVTGGQLPHESAEFPYGLGLPFEPGAILLMQTHVVNATGAPIDATVHVEFNTTDAAHVQNRVGTFRFYNPFIVVPAGGTATASMRCHIHHKVNLISGGSHMHARGTDYRAFVGDSAEPFYTTKDWQHPPYFLGLLSLVEGDSIRFECDYKNSSDFDVIQGTSALDNEMCMFSGFYYPAQDADEEDCVSMDMHGTGDRSCAQTTSCISLCDPAESPRFDEGTAEVGACFQKCIVDSCPNVTETLFPQLTCTTEECANECKAYDATCSACVAAKCKSQLDACQALACD